MPVQEFECQIARGQIGRYLNGEGLSSEALRQLGAHVAECSECKSFLDHRKAALQGMLGERDMPDHQEVRAVVDVKPSDALIAQIKARSVIEESEPEPQPVATRAQVKPVLTKPIIYCGVLALVLVGMTYISRNPSGLLGPKASDLAVASQPPAAKTAAVTAKPAPAPVSPPASTTATIPTTTPTTTPTNPKSNSTPPTTDAKTDAGKPAAGMNAETAKPASVTIAPDKKTPTSLVADPSPPAAETAPKAKADAPAPRKKWRRKPAVRHHWSLHHLQPGTGAIHVYHS